MQGHADTQLSSASEYDSNDDNQVSSSSKSATSRTSAKTLYWIIKIFNEVKRQCVREIGFGGTLEIPLWNSISRIFSTWLLANVDCTNLAIVVDKLRMLPFVPEDVNRAFGVPCGTRDVLGPETRISNTALAYIREQAGIPGNKVSLKDAERIVLMELTADSTRLEKDSFKMAYVIIVMGHMLSPSTKYDHVNADFLGALRCTEEIGQYNWCAYIIKGIIDAANKVQDDITKNRVVSNIAGAHIFLQVHYLDNLLLGPLQPKKNIFPRCKVFPTDVINKLILADTKPGGGYGACKFNARGISIAPTPSTSHIVAAASTINPLKNQMGATPATSAPLFSNVPPTYSATAALTAATLPRFLREKYPQLNNTALADAFKQYNANMTRAMNERHSAEKNSTLQQNLWLADKVLRFISSHSTGNQLYCRMSGLKHRHSSAQIEGTQKTHAYETEADSKDRAIESTPKRSSPTVNNASSIKKCKSDASASNDDSTKTPPPPAPTCTPCSPAATRACMEVVMADLILRTDNVDCPESKVLFGHFSASPPDKRRTRKGVFAPSPWSEGYIHPKPPGDLMVSLMDWISDAGLQYMKIKWMTSEFPRYIFVPGSEIRDQIVRSTNLDFELCDLLLRRFTQLDTMMEPNSSKFRWRHILESDFSLFSQAMMSPHSYQSANNSSANKLGTTCHAPACLPYLRSSKDIWCAYIFDMKEEIIHVLDPFLQQDPVGKMKDLHIHTSGLLHYKLFDCLNNFFENWNPTKKDWPLVFPILTNDKFRKEQSGLCMLHCLRNYNGDELEQPLTLKGYSRLQHTFLYEILTIEKNKTRLPVPVLKIIGEPKD
ncbi:hypothetical protein BRADI_4g07956v3 [Brachypodium distachyon]|uniref:Ubiquitin-like protease family profile domain-containing protein n=1 Tax=Brachypodium distachyon TaxID=15368 RepID=A0A2K2CL66_BRADI|nr:hypothetical protein BRADI_4g07956v3 [Brachypodium distachyon]PNT62773.1 hypothetical protein BRADI_4g07956v3 [Brachypodium distachyon]PNT62776.1 hypothetical protein BRADI_4g07956v3 [Brachypodium distachyon]